MKRALFLLALISLPAAAAAPTLAQCQQIGPLKLGMPEKQLAALLGKPASESKPISEAATGMTVKERNYARLGLKVTLAQESAGKPWSVDRFRADPPCPWKMPQGIGLGTPSAQVRKTYAGLLDQEMTSSQQVVVGSVYGGVIFTLKNDKVQSIFVGAAAE